MPATRLIRAVTKQRYLGAGEKIEGKNDSCLELRTEMVENGANESWCFLFYHTCFDVSHVFVSCKTYLRNYSEACIISYNSPCNSFKKEGGDDHNTCVTVNCY